MALIIRWGHSLILNSLYTRPETISAYRTARAAVSVAVATPVVMQRIMNTGRQIARNASLVAFRIPLRLVLGPTG